MTLNTNQFETFLKNEEKLHWCKLGDDGIPELYLDHHMMSTFRMCEQAFVHSFIDGYGGKGRVWFLDLGTAVHKMIEIYYIARKFKKFDLQYWATVIAPRIWNEMNMDFYKTGPNKLWSKKYEELGGLMGFVGLLVQYAQYFNLENERMRVVGTELYFGKGKEVPILVDAGKYIFAPFRMYLSGKIDLLIDDGQSIGPMDHKTASNFMGKNPNITYEVQEGMTGYVFAAQKLVKNFPDVARKPCNKIWMNHLQIAIPGKDKDGKEKGLSERFKRLPLMKTDEQLEDYRLRQISTGVKIFNLLVNSELVPDWNTTVCTNWFHSTCAYQSAHRQGSKSSLYQILNSEFVKKGIWNPETIDQEENAVNNIMKEEIANVA